MTVGIDAVLEQDSEGIWDFVVGDDGDIKSEDAFETAILVSLFTDRRADETEIQHPPNRRGWVGNLATPGREMGSKFWLLAQKRSTEITANEIDDLGNDALIWFVEDDVADSIAAEGLLIAGGAALNAIISTPTSETVKRYYELWRATGD